MKAGWRKHALAVAVAGDNNNCRGGRGKRIDSLFERHLVIVDLFSRELFELKEHVFGAHPLVELRRHWFPVLQRLVDLLPSVEHGRQFVAIRRPGR